MQRFTQSLHPDAKDVLTFDFSSALLSGETLIGPATISVAMHRGADDSPSSLINGTAQLDGTATQVLVPVQGRVEDCEYEIECKCATTNSKKFFAVTAILAVGR